MKKRRSNVLRGIDLTIEATHEDRREQIRSNSGCGIGNLNGYIRDIAEKAREQDALKQERRKLSARVLYDNTVAALWSAGVWTNIGNSKRKLAPADITSKMKTIMDAFERWELSKQETLFWYSFLRYNGKKGAGKPRFISWDIVCKLGKIARAHGYKAPQNN